MAEYLTFKDNTTMIITNGNLFYYSKNSSYLSELRDKSRKSGENPSTKPVRTVNKSNLSLLLI